jgi:anti-anti-sigma factor
MDHDDTELTTPTPHHIGDDAGAAYRITPSGELDLATIDPVRDDVEAALAEGATAIEFDLTDVTFLDSSALAVFAYTARQVAHVRVTNPNPIARRVIEQTGLADVLHLTP